MKKIDIVAPVECPTLSPERQVLWDAANYMEKHGQCKHVLRDVGGAVCLMGAINTVETGNPFDFGRLAIGCADLVAKRLGLVGSFNVVEWNNAPERTAAEVIQALRDAALS